MMQQTPPHDQHNAALLQMLPAGLSHVVDVGCMRGALARAYREKNPDSHWTGIDIMPDNAEAARKYCQETLCCNIENLSDAEFSRFNKAQAWIFGDTLEHLLEPGALLARIRSIIPADGMIITSIPNAQNWNVQMRLNNGQFRYEESGLLDRSHIRFFTRITILEMFQQAGYRVETMGQIIVSSPLEQYFMPHIRAMAAAGGFDPNTAEADARAFQYVLKAVPA